MWSKTRPSPGPKTLPQRSHLPPERLRAAFLTFWLNSSLAMLDLVVVDDDAELGIAAPVLVYP